MATHEGLNREAVRWLRCVREDETTGRLESRTTSEVREIFFREGRIAGIRTSVEAERLGNLLMRIGRITKQHFDDASIFVRKGIRIGQILAELRIIDPAEIDPMLRRQAMDVACAILNGPDGAVRFEETSELFITLETALAVSDVIMEATRRVPSPVLEALRQDTLFQPVDSSFLVECSGLTPEDVYLLSRFQGGATVDGVLKASGLGEEAALRSALGLIACGMLEPGDGEAVRKQRALRDDVHRMFELLKKKDPWRALGLPADVGIETARAAFRDAVRKYHPDRYQGVIDPGFQKELASVCEGFTNAFSCLTTALNLRRTTAAHDGAIALASTMETPIVRGPSLDPVSATEPATGEAQARCDDEVYSKEAKRALLRQDYWRAIELLRVAITERGDHAPYHFLLAEALSKNPRWRHAAEQSYRRAIELDPCRREYYGALAKLYERVGLGHRAESLQREAQEMGVAMSGVA